MGDKGQSEAISLLAAVESKIQKTRTRTLDISFNELLDMHRNKELIIEPEYQRMFRWSLGKESRLIESLILELPIPPVFVIELAEGKYELIDGLQRISSYLHFRGELENWQKMGLAQRLVLEECDIATELNGLTFEELPEAIRIRLKRSFVRVEIIRKESNRKLRYYMFKRLNTGGEALSEQEIRNCTIRLLDTKFNNFLIQMARVAEFKTCISFISDAGEKEKYDEELVLRFFAFKNYRDEFKHDIGDFLTNYMEGVSQPFTETTFEAAENVKRQTTEDKAIPFDYSHEEQVFKKTFSVLAATLGERIFSKTNDRGTLISRFMVLHFEAFTLGIQRHLDSLVPSDSAQMARLTTIFTSIKNDPVFKEHTTGGGKNRPGALNERIGYVEDYLDLKL